MPSPTDLVSLLRCAHRVYLDVHGDPAEKGATSSFLQLLWEGGRLHEEEVIRKLDVVSAHTEFSQEARIAETKRLMAEGHPRIHHGLLAKGDFIGEPDLLERVEQPSDLGAYAYIPVEIKAAGAYEDPKKTKPKEPYLVQLSAYAELLEETQGWLPDRGTIIDGEGVAHTFDLAGFRDTYLAVRARYAAVVAGAETTQPGWKSAVCAQCVWQDACVKRLQAADDLTMIAGVGESHRAKLVSIGIRTGAELAAADPATLRSAKGIGAAFSAAFVRQAQVQKSGTHLVLESWCPPEAEFEVSYDIEDFTPDPFVYLHGLLVRDAGAKPHGSDGHASADFGVFDPVCAAHPQTEEDVWRLFLEKVRAFEQRGEYVVYVYSHHEQDKLKKLSQKYGGGDEVERFSGRFVDLMKVAKKHVVFPTDAMSLKSLARYAGFDWRDADPGGAQSMAWWADYWNDPVANAALRDRVIAYNEDDVRASFVLRDWLAGNCR